MKDKSSLFTPLLALCLLAPTAAQQPQRPEPSRPTTAAAAPQQTAGPDDDDVVRITSNLVQLDVIVTDKDGRPVTDLRPEEFQLFEDGKERELTNFSFVSTTPEPLAGTAAAASPPSRPVKGAPPTAVRPLHRRQVRRTIGLVVDNLNSSFGEVSSIREGVRKFINEQMRPGDLVGIYTTRGGVGALQQFTADKAQLHRAADRIRWYPPPPTGTPEEALPGNAPRIERVAPRPEIDGAMGAQPAPPVTLRGAPPDDYIRRRRIEDRNRDLMALDITGTLRYVLRGMQEAPGRKSIVVFAKGQFLMDMPREESRLTTAFNRISDAANRASVVIYAVDARGLYNPAEMGADASAPPTDFPSGPDLRHTPPTLSPVGARVALADRTGGLFLHSMNFFEKALERVLLDQSGYYLLGYRPDDETFKGGHAAFRKISVKVTRPGVRVRTRSGFAAVTDEEARREVRGSDSELYTVLASPVTAGGVYVRLTAGVVGDPRGGPTAARMLLHVDGKDLTFTDAPEGGGYKKLVLDVAAVTLDQDGKIVDEFTRTHTVRTGGEHLDNIVRNGLTYTADVPVKKPGTYQLRIVVRDQGSQRLGSASQRIDIPDLSKARLALSGLSLREVTAGSAQQQQAPPQSARPTAETAIAAVTSPSDPAVRRFRPGAILAYGTQVYHTTPGGPGGGARLTAQVTLFHNGQPVVTGAPTAVEFDPAQPGWLEGALRLVPEAKPGEYILQVVVTDESVKDKDRRQASQWIDFEVVR